MKIKILLALILVLFVLSGCKKDMNSSDKNDTATKEQASEFVTEPDDLELIVETTAPLSEDETDTPTDFKVESEQTLEKTPDLTQSPTHSDQKIDLPFVPVS